MPFAGAAVVRAGRWSVVVPWSSVLLVGVGVIAMAVVSIWGLTIGDPRLPIGTVLDGLRGEADPVDVLIVREFRLPRAVGAVVAGFGLGVSGCLTQALARNRLATPELLGVDGGALVVLLLMGAGASATGIGTWIAGPLGGIVAAALLVALAGGIAVSGARIIVVGLALSALLTAVGAFVLARVDLSESTSIFRWTIGSLNGRDLRYSRPAAIGLAVVVPAAVLSARRLHAVGLGDAVAAGLGVHVVGRRMVTLVLAVLAAGFAVGVGGPIAFVALGSPVIAARWSDPHRLPVVTSGIIGAVLVGLADIVARWWGGIEQLPVGVVTAILGGPLLLWIVLRDPAGARS